MPRRTARPRPAKKARTAPKTREMPGDTYLVTLRTPTTEMVAKAQDKILYPLAVSWNRALASHKTHCAGSDENWHEASRKAIDTLAAEGEIEPGEVDAFIRAAAASDVVEVDIEWKDEETGYAARIFPWEGLLSLATKRERVKLGRTCFAVVRVLKVPVQGRTATGKPLFAPFDPGIPGQVLDFDAEFDALNTSIPSFVRLKTTTLDQLAADLRNKKPSIIHFAGSDRGKGPMIALEPGDKPAAQRESAVASAVARHRPELAVFSSCYSGRRLAPLAIAAGAAHAIGFQGEVDDCSVPLFFGAFYHEWEKSKHDIISSLRMALDAHNSQRDSNALGGVSIWSANSLMAGPAAIHVPNAKTLTPSTRRVTKHDLSSAFRVDFAPRSTLNYSVLHNDRSGLFDAFTLTKKPEGIVPPVLVTVRLTTGAGRPTECSFTVQAGLKAYDFTNLAQRLALPLGASLIRQRGESLQATLETEVTCEDIILHRDVRPIAVLPCDEWRDDEMGRHFLPSFVFPRNPAIRDIISAAQPFLRALLDRPQAGFDGYQQGSAENVNFQVRAFWAALQHTLRLDYINSQATYTARSQRVRTPDEIIRSRRATCIELTLLLAACLEHVGISPVLFLVRGHAFCGYWTSERARKDFTSEASSIVKKAMPKDKDPFDPGLAEGNGVKQSTVPWRFNARYHPKAILTEIDVDTLVAVEATFVAFQKSFEDSRANATERLRQIADLDEPLETFDGMFDVQAAREAGITPLPILIEGPAA